MLFPVFNIFKFMFCSKVSCVNLHIFYRSIKNQKGVIMSYVFSQQVHVIGWVVRPRTSSTTSSSSGWMAWPTLWTTSRPEPTWTAGEPEHTGKMRSIIAAV